MHATITLPETEYERLRKIAERYELLRNAMTDNFFEEPPVRNAKEIIGAFRKTGLYTGAFLKSLSRGFKESLSFGKNRYEIAHRPT